jgi:hypothetical protein
MPIANIAVFNSANGIGLGNFDETRVVQLQLPPLPPGPPPQVGRYVLFGKVVIANRDGDPQNASARMITDGAIELDRVDVRIAEQGQNDRQTITLLGHFTQNVGRPIIDIRCATFDGEASQADLYAIRVDELQSGAP